MLRRLAGELSERLGAVTIAIGIEHEEVVRFVLLEAGRVVDEYLSVPEHYGPLPPGDAIALAANPRVVARLTGAEPAAVRAAARTAASPRRCPRRRAARTIARAIGLEGTEHGWEGAPELPGPSRWRGHDHALRRRPLPLLRAGADRSRREGRSVRDGRDRSRRPPGLALRAEPGRKGAGARGGRLGAARVGRHRRVPERALSRACALARRPRRAGGGAAARLPLRRLLEAVLRAAAQRGGRVASGSARRSAGSTACSRDCRGCRGAPSASPTSPTSRGCCGRAARSGSRSSRGRTSPPGSSAPATGPAVAAERELVAAL